MDLARKFMDQWELDMKNPYSCHPQITGDEMDLDEIRNEVVDTWRWGNHVEVIYSDGQDFIKVTYRDASGDGEIDGYDMMVEAINVQPISVTITDYKVVE